MGIMRTKKSNFLFVLLVSIKVHLTLSGNLWPVSKGEVLCIKKNSMATGATAQSIWFQE